MAYSFPFAAVAGTAFGIVAGEAASRFAEKHGADDRAARVVRRLVHGTVHLVTGWAVNTAMVDPVGAAVTPVTAVMAAQADLRLPEIFQPFVEEQPEPRPQAA